MSTDDTAYQIAPQVEALQAERANCVAYGNDARVEAIDRQLADLGVKKEAAKKRAAAADGDKDAKSEPPKGRRSATTEQASNTSSAEGAVTKNSKE